MISMLYGESSPRRLAYFVGGKPFAGESGRWGDIFNPATGEVVAQVPLGNVALMPHIGSSSRATRMAMAMTVADNLIAVFSGARPPNLLNPEVLT